MSNNLSPPPNLLAATRQLNLSWALGWILIVSFTALSYLVGPIVILPPVQGIPAGTITLLLLVLSGIEIGALSFVRGKILNGNNARLLRGQAPPTPVARYISASFITSALTGGIAIHGLVAYLIDRFVWAPAVFAVLACLPLLYFRPDTGELRRLLAKPPTG
ncbi:MAG: hypothetical protein P9E24_11500 [Candidatus Competibacter sp.]|nr:hypothetical protein [Candidatus Competibacter sp.]MDG4584429.1 hypothetical protein [Candidatus Competibacter sp.]